MPFQKAEGRDIFPNARPLRLKVVSNSGKPIISRKCKCLYYSIPKAACTTVKKFLFELENPQNRGKKSQSPHAVVFDKIDFDNAAQKKYQDYFSFAFVRNPWDRLVTCYFNKVRGPAQTRTCNQVIVNGEYRDFIRSYGYCGFRYMTFTDFVRFVS